MQTERSRGNGTLCPKLIPWVDRTTRDYWSERRGDRGEVVSSCVVCEAYGSFFVEPEALAICEDCFISKIQEGRCPARPKKRKPYLKKERVTLRRGRATRGDPESSSRGRSLFRESLKHLKH